MASTRCADPKLGILFITHYQRLLDYIVPDYVHVMVQGQNRPRAAVRRLALELEEKGYDWVKRTNRAAGASINHKGGHIMSQRSSTRSISTGWSATLSTRRAHEFDAGTGLTNDTVRVHLRSEERARVDPGFSAEARSRLSWTSPCRRIGRPTTSNAINFDKIRYYLANGQKPTRTWDDVPDDVKRTFERLGIPEQERKFLAGVEAQFDSEAVYSNIKKAVGEQGVIFVGSTEGLMKHPESSASGSAR